ncbi:hypothetical protein EI42_00563 [Thermosporothrix hazakensis]|jgi:sporulation protein YlmC with PRC-barrel domain|uniref:PRC-barrel domain-containing protein n=1 Tax=Thermosporothrix hazakensis TaxID=644383 RepID=A0A326UQR7_THEHA|nr:PRC-barrel domain-containing protein [Thermosporothrix hazakensis]PZW36389.1 hypothetical protein EI42_00563 [Thermosporothrix hazakensis]GCE47038.1 hypothetical protein KTH_19070 [Thermosporothrix hazakensis]
MRVLRIEEVLDKRIVSTEGKLIGHVLDIQVSKQADKSTEPTYTITALLCGRYGLLHRLHVALPFARLLKVRPDTQIVLWEHVLRVEKKAIIVRSLPDKQSYSVPAAPEDE